MAKKTIAVVGATGAQGRGVVDALVDNGTFHVRALTRHPDSYSGRAHEAIGADLDATDSLRDAFRDAYGVFAVTNFWEGADEVQQGKNAIEAAKEAGVQHLVWSTLPNVEAISNGEFNVPHFTGKAQVDALVKSAGYKYHTFVQAPFYYQNLVGMLSPQPQHDGTHGWTLPIDPTKKVIHMSDIHDLGKVVAGALLQPDAVGNGRYLSLATELNSFNDILAAFRNAGKSYSFTQVPGDLFATFFEGARELAEMFGYFEKYTYMGPGAKERIDLAKRTANGDFLSLEAWIRGRNT
jgi:uncharacterized protein YbjT (DUF2867 family)